MEVEDSTQMEINISNVNAEKDIVLNDQRLLELLLLYPFLFSRRVQPHDDMDYEDWAWERIAEAFNASYANVQLSSPFTVEELQWRWDILKPILPTLSRANGQIPDALWILICRVHRMMEDSEPPLTKPLSNSQQFVLEQTDFIENLPEAQRRCMEMEVLDAIFQEERKLRATIPLGKKEFDYVDREYSEFLKAIRVKELQKTLNASDSKVDKEEDSTANDMITSSTNIINSCETGLIISSVCSEKEQTHISDFQDNEISSSNKTTKNQEEGITIKTEPQDEDDDEDFTPPLVTPSKDCTDTDYSVQLQSVPLKCAKYYMKPLRVRVKRLKLDTYPLLVAVKVQLGQKGSAKKTV